MYCNSIGQKQLENMQNMKSQEALDKDNSSSSVNSSKYTKWNKQNIPFQGGFQKFKAIKKEDRSKEYIKRLKNRQREGEPPAVFLKKIPDSGKFTFEGYELHYHSIEQIFEPKAIVVYCHGTDRHSGECGFLVSEVTRKNPELNFYAFDQMNFGQSQGPYRGEVTGIESTLSQLDTFITFILGRLSSQPKIFLSGSSYGGSVIYQAAMISPKKYSGLLLFCPALKDMKEMLWLKKKFSLFAKCLLPRVRCGKISRKVPKYNQFDRISKDPHNIIDGVLLGNIANGHHVMLEIEPTFGDFEAPYILFQGGADKIVDVFGPIDLGEKCKSRDKTTVYCQEMWHDAMNEEQIEGISWMSAERLKDRI